MMTKIGTGFPQQQPILKYVRRFKPNCEPERDFLFFFSFGCIDLLVSSDHGGPLLALQNQVVAPFHPLRIALLPVLAEAAMDFGQGALGGFERVKLQQIVEGIDHRLNLMTAVGVTVAIPGLMPNPSFLSGRMKLPWPLMLLPITAQRTSDWHVPAGPIAEGSQFLLGTQRSWLQRGGNPGQHFDVEPTF